MTVVAEAGLSAPASAQRTARGGGWLERRRRRAGLLFVAPVFLFLCAVIVFPLASAVPHINSKMVPMLSIQKPTYFCFSLL